MLKNTVSGMSAQKLRIILVVTILVLLAIGVASFIFARGLIASYAVDVAKADTVAKSSDENVRVLKKLKSELADNQDSVVRTKDLVAESQSYAYQDQIITDLNRYASKSGVAIAGYAFNSDTATAGAATPAAGTATTPAAPATGAGIKTVSATITLKSPMKYENLMTFIHYIEQNLTKMQLAGVSVNKDPSSGNVSASTLTLEVYVR